MLTILVIVAPVFALVTTGYLAVHFNACPRSGIPGLLAFVNNFAVPILLFRAMLDIDFAAVFNPKMIAGYYFSALIVLVSAIVIARALFRNRPGEAVASAFGAYFSNTVLLGLPIVQRAYGDEALPVMYSIIGFHAPTLMTVSLIAMEISRRDGAGAGHVAALAIRRIFTHPLLIGIALGLLGNLFGIALIEPADAFTRMMAQAVLPTALFGLGGALHDYRVRDNWLLSATMSLIKLMAMPALVFFVVAVVLGVDHDIAKIAVITSAMPSGINAYVFATSYNRSVEVAASSILITTALSVVTVSFWLYVLAL
ncbi:MAG: AEC family transporter [Alphaproteobacteria bacterium]|nr:AEC family transporter [Alphaproteobacteria bacterium]